MADQHDGSSTSGSGEGVLGIHSLDHFALTVPELEEARFFYSEFGLDVRESDDGLELYTFGNPHRWAILRKGDRKKLDYLSFGAYEADMPRFRARLAEIGVDLIDPPAGVKSNGIWFRNHDGMPVEIQAAERSMPDTKAEFNVTSVPAGESAAVPRSKAPRVHPRRLAHFLMFTSNVPRDLEFYAKTLGLKLSDRSGDAVAFMHGVHGSDHHLLALAGSDGSGMHHCSWDIGSIQEVGLGAAHMESKGFTKGWGLGRHVLGANYFHYVQDPWGSYCEYSCDIDYIPAGFDWPAEDHPPEDSLYLWGPPLPEGFITNYETQQQPQPA